MRLSRTYCNALRLLCRLRTASLHTKQLHFLKNQLSAVDTMRVTRSSRHAVLVSSVPDSDNRAAANAGAEAAVAPTASESTQEREKTVSVSALGQYLTHTAAVTSVDSRGQASSHAAAAAPETIAPVGNQQANRSRRAASSKQAATRAHEEPHAQHQQQQQIVRSRKRRTAASGNDAPAGAAYAAADSAATERAAGEHGETDKAEAPTVAKRRQRTARSDAAQQGTAGAQQTVNPLIASATAAAAAATTTASGAVSAIGLMAAGIRSSSAAAAGGVGDDRAAAAGSASCPVLLDLGELVVGEVLKRPSATVKTPYVADVRLSCGTEVLAHTPALDCAGLMLPGSRVHMTANVPKGDGQKATKTSHAVQLVQDECEDGTTTAVGAHPYLAEKLSEAAVAQHLLPLPAELQNYTNVLKQQTVGKGRFDFVLCYEDGSRLLLEVKNAVCADYPAGRVPAWRSKVCLYTVEAEQYSRTALFPVGTASKSSGVVSDRAIKHLHELTKLQQAGQDDQGRAVRCAVMFIVNRSDCTAFRPCHEADMMFARMLHRAQQAGVLVMAHDVIWQVGVAVWGKPLPVVYGAAVQAADIDKQQLQAVLEFNATNPRTHWKRKKESGCRPN